MHAISVSTIDEVASLLLSEHTLTTKMIVVMAMCREEKRGEERS